MESVTSEGMYIVGCQACLPRQVESNPDTGTVFGLHVFTAHQSGIWITSRTPEDPLVQDSLTCYVYLQLKMPGHKGTIIVHGSRKIALECEEGDAAYAKSVC